MKEEFVIESLAAKVLAGEASPEEKRRLQEWIEVSSENQRYFDELRAIFHGADANSGEVFDTESAWERMREKITAGSARPRGRQIAFTFWWQAAAVVAFFIVAGIFLQRGITDPEPDYSLVSGNAITGDTLPDGTTVLLNRHTSLRHAYHAEENLHAVALDGEAYFEISPEESKIFIVNAGETFVRDIGTSFNVKAYSDSSSVEVFVHEGEVVFYTSQDSGIVLKAGEKGKYDRQSRQFFQEKPNRNELAYKTRNFIFDNQRLSEVVRSLNAVYDKKLIMGRELGRCRLTVSFNDESIEEISEVIAETLGLAIEQSGDSILLTGKGCE